MRAKADREKRTGRRAAPTLRAASIPPDVRELDIQRCAARKRLLQILRHLQIVHATAHTCALAVRSHESVDDAIDVETTLKNFVLKEIRVDMVRLREIIEVLPGDGDTDESQSEEC